MNFVSKTKITNFYFSIIVIVVRKSLNGNFIILVGDIITQFFVKFCIQTKFDEYSQYGQLFTNNNCKIIINYTFNNFSS